MNDIFLWIVVIGLVWLITLTIVVAVDLNKNQTIIVTPTITITPTITPIMDTVITQIVWKESATTSGNLIGSWSEVCDLIVKNNEILTIYVDDSLAPCIVNQTINCQSRVQFYAATFVLPNSIRLQFADGFSLIDPLGFGQSLIVEFFNTGTPNIIMQNFGVLQIAENAVLTNSINNTSPGMRIDDNKTMLLSFNTGSHGSVGPAPNVPLVELGINSQLIFAPLGSVGSGFDNNIISSIDSSALLLYNYDSQSPRLTNTGFLGTLVEIPLSQSANIFFDDTLFSTNFGNNTQTAIDYIKQIFTSAQPVPGNMDFNNHNISNVQNGSITNLTLGITPNTYNMPTSITNTPNNIGSTLLYDGTPNLIFREPMYGTASLHTGLFSITTENTWYQLFGTFVFVGSPNIIVEDDGIGSFVAIKNNTAQTRTIQIVCNMSCATNNTTQFEFGIKNNGVDSNAIMSAFLNIVASYQSIGFSQTLTMLPGTHFELIMRLINPGSATIFVDYITLSIMET
jgi:hypothetical protein